MNNRLERLISFLVVWLTMFSFNDLCAQNSFTEGIKRDFYHLQYPGISMGNVKQKNLFLNTKSNGNQVFSIPFRLTMSGNQGPVYPEGIYAQSPNFFYLQSGYFCKREWELEK